MDRHELPRADCGHDHHAKTSRQRPLPHRFDDPSGVALGSGRQWHNPILQQKRDELLTGHVQHGHHPPLLLHIIQQLPQTTNKTPVSQELAGVFVESSLFSAVCLNASITFCDFSSYVHAGINLDFNNIIIKSHSVIRLHKC